MYISGVNKWRDKRGRQPADARAAITPSACGSSAIWRLARRSQRQRITVAELFSRAQALVERAADDPVMIEQPQRLVRDELLELVPTRSSARDIGGAGFGRNVVPPVPTQRVIVDRKLPGRSLDRRARRQKTLDPQALGVIAALA